MNPADGFEATFVVRIDREAAWRRLTGTPDPEASGHLWLGGFDARVTIVEAEAPERLRATKDDEPCAGTEIVVTLDDERTGTRIHVVQSRFGDWLNELRETMAVGWRYIVADLHAYLATGIHPGRFMSAWVDLGADATAADGGIRVRDVRPDGPAAHVGLLDGDLLLTLNGAPLASLDDLVVALRVAVTAPVTASWIRTGVLMATTPAADA